MSGGPRVSALRAIFETSIPRDGAGVRGRRPAVALSGSPEGGGRCAPLTLYQVGLCNLLLEYEQETITHNAIAVRRLSEPLFGDNNLSLRTLERELCTDKGGCSGTCSSRG